VRVKRRQILQALGAGALFTSSLSRGQVLLRPSAPLPKPSGAGSGPPRIVFYVQPHGHIPSTVNMSIPGGSTTNFAEMPLTGLAQSDLSSILRPLYPFADRLLAIEGLCHTSALVDIEDVTLAGTGDLNNHQVGVADVLTCNRALQQPGTYCTGGGISIDQLLANRLAAPGRYGSRVYGFNYVPNSVVSPFSYLGSGEATPMVSDPATAYADLQAYLAPVLAPQHRQAVLESLRSNVLGTVADEYNLLAPQLGTEGRQKLQQHAALVQNLERSLGVVSAAASCNTTFSSASDGTIGTSVRQFMKLIKIAFACDLTRVVCFTAPVPPCPELGYPADTDFHAYAHESMIPTACGVAYSGLAAQAITDLDTWHAGHVAYLLELLDGIPEGSGTMLDNTVVVWVSELATPTHLHNDVFTVLAGGCNGFFETGRYVRYPRNIPSPQPNMPLIGPPQNRLYVSLLRAMGQQDDTFGMTSAVAHDGTPLSFNGPLTELHA
jgi:hypothetical protein